MGISKTLQTGSTLPRYVHAVDLTSPIGIKWTSLGGQAVTGVAVSDATPPDDGIGLVQLFALGAIFWSPAFGAVYMSERVWRKWSSPDVERRKTADGTIIQEYLGYPTDDTMRHDTRSGNREWSYFENGMIYVGPEGAFVVYGDIYGHYRVLDGLSGLMGVPISDEMAAPGGGRVSHFLQGDIFLHRRTGVHEVHGAIRDRYLDLGGPGGILGYPISDEQGLRGKQEAEIGRASRFENGSGIYFSNATGAWEVYGAIWSKWQSNGGVTGKLGFPTSGETDTPTSGGRFNEFQNGVVVWHGGGPYAGAFEVTDLQMVIGEYTCDEDFNVQVHVSATPNQVNNGRMPADGEFDAGTKDFTPSLIMVSIGPVRANSVINVWMEAISENVIGSDDRMGTITTNFTIDNVWGLLDTDFKHHDNQFDAVFRVKPGTDDITTNPDELFWPFHNTSTFKMSWETFARTFRDVVESDKNLNFNPLDFSVHPWEIFLYETFYNSLAQGGSCFGMCLESIYAREKLSLLLEPIQSNPFNPYQRNHRLGVAATDLNPDLPGDGFTLNEVNVKHGYQIGAGMIEFFLSRWMAGALHDPERAYRESYADFQSGNWPLLTISDQDEFSQEHGHALLPYEWDPLPDNIHRSFPGQPLIIYVKNPNFPLAPHGDKHCRIEIDRLTWKWKFQFDDNEEWTGSGNTGGRLLAIPFTELNARPVTPGYGVLGLLAAGVFLVLAGDGETEQITDGYGRTFFHYKEIQERLKHVSPGPTKTINWNADTRVPNLMQVPMFAALGNLKGTTTEDNPGLRTVQRTPEFFYHRPGPAPKDASTRFVQNTSTIVGVNSQRRPGAVGEQLAAAPGGALHHQIRGRSHGSVRWTLVAPRMSANVVATTEPGVIDSVHIGGTGGHFQNLTVQFPNATKTRNVSLTVTGWRGEERHEAKSFVLEGLSLSNTDSIHAQITDGGKELIVENIGSAKIFDLHLVVGLNGDKIAVRPGVSIDASSVVRFRPSSWSRVASATAPIRFEVLDKTWLKVLKSTDV
jgi:LGFP repeat